MFQGSLTHCMCGIFFDSCSPRWFVLDSYKLVAYKKLIVKEAFIINSSSTVNIIDDQESWKNLFELRIDSTKIKDSIVLSAGVLDPITRESWVAAI